MDTTQIRNLLKAFQQFAGWQKLVIGLMVIIIVLTWLAVCLVLAGYLLP